MANNIKEEIILKRKEATEAAIRAAVAEVAFTGKPARVLFLEKFDPNACEGFLGEKIITELSDSGLELYRDWTTRWYVALK